MTDMRVRFTVAPRPVRRRVLATAVAALLGATGLLAGNGTGAAAATPPAAPAASHTYTVTPTGTGAHDLAEVLEHLVQPSDVVLLADGVYRVSNIEVTVPNVTIRAQHMPAAGASSPRVWLDGSIPYRWWQHPSDTIWSHSYDKDFCATTLRNLPCNQLSVSYHGDQLLVGGTP